MNDSFKQLATTNKVSKQICKIDISGYSFDNYKTINPDGYTILCNLGEVSDGFTYFPPSSRLILNMDQQSKIIRNFKKLVPNMAEEFGTTEQAATEKLVDFFFKYTAYHSAHWNPRKSL